MDKPNYAPNFIGDVMSKCWEKEPKKRPTFSQIVEIIRGNMESAVSSYYLHLDAPYQKFNQEKEFAPKTKRFGLSKMLNKNSKQIAFPHRVEGYDVGLQSRKSPERFSSTRSTHGVNTRVLIDTPANGL